MYDKDAKVKVGLKRSQSLCLHRLGVPKIVEFQSAIKCQVATEASITNWENGTSRQESKLRNILMHRKRCSMIYEFYQPKFERGRSL
jgi:hypothetical protein